MLPIKSLKLNIRDKRVLVKAAHYCTEKKLNLVEEEPPTKLVMQINEELEITSTIAREIMDYGWDLFALSGVPVPEDLEPTPHDDKWRHSKQVLPSDVLHWCVGDMFGIPIKQYDDEHGGNFLHNIMTVHGHEGEKSSSGDTPFPYHVEVPQDTQSPRWLSLACLRGNPSVATGFVDSRALMIDLNQQEREAVMKNSVDLRINDSFDAKGEWMQIQIYNPLTDKFIFDSVEMRPKEGGTDVEHAVYWRIMEALDNAVKTEVVLYEGDFALFNNHHVLHSRKEFPDGLGERWLTRSYY